MAPEFGSSQVMTASSASPVIDPDEIELPSMEDLDELVIELDQVDATLAALR